MYKFLGSQQTTVEAVHTRRGLGLNFLLIYDVCVIHYFLSWLNI